MLAVNLACNTLELCRLLAAQPLSVQTFCRSILARRCAHSQSSNVYDLEDGKLLALRVQRAQYAGSNTHLGWERLFQVEGAVQGHV